MSVEHKARALKFKCSDWRFEEMIDADTKSRGLNGNSDEISWPEASKNFDKVNTAAILLLQLHDPDQALIYEHQDCGAYGENNSEETHRTNAQKLADSLKTAKPKLEIEILFVTSEGIKEL